MKNIDIYKFEKFIAAWQSEPYSRLKGDECMRQMGFKSAMYEIFSKDNKSWQLSEEEYTWFVLRWS
jgi:hypothetical protein